MTAVPARWRSRLLVRLRPLLEAGTEPYTGRDRLGLIVANMTGGLGVVSALAFAVTYAVHDYATLKPLVWGNVALAAGCAVTALFHRFGRTAAALWLTFVFFTSLTYFASLLGREAGVTLNLIAAAAVAFAILGLRRIGIVTAITVTAAVIVVATSILYPAPAPGIAADPAFMRQIFITSIVSVMSIIYVVIYYAFLLTRQAQARTEELLRAIMPDAVAERLMRNPGATIAERYDDVVVLFSDIAGFVDLSNRLGPARIVALLDALFRAYDELAARHGVEKIKTIGDAYMAVAGVPEPHPDPARAVAALARDMIAATASIGAGHGLDIEIRVGMACGPVMAGVVGQSKYSYDVWGTPVNLAARLESAGIPGHVVMTGDLKVRLDGAHRFRRAGSIDLKGFGRVPVWCMDCATEEAA